MLKQSLTFFIFFCTCYLPIRAQDIETTIRALETREVQAILSKDSVTLLKLWDKNYTVNSPYNNIYAGGSSTLDRPVLKRSRTSFTREIEKIIIRDSIVICMGNETVIPAEPNPHPGNIVKRRYTNIWMKQGIEWILIARHANVICEPGK